MKRQEMIISHNYLPQQFADPEPIFTDIRRIVADGDFTLGKEVERFEKEFAAVAGTTYAVAVANGTDAIFLALKALGVKGGEIITTPYSFYATTASIVHAGARPVYVDVAKDFNIDPDKIEAAITPYTVGIVLVHWAGYPCWMKDIIAIALRHAIFVVEDCAHAPLATLEGKPCGSFGALATFSLHPLKNVNVWGDGGVIATNHERNADWLRRARNHGMLDRNTAQFWGWNSRLDTVQAVVARHVLRNLASATERKRANGRMLDKLLCQISQIELPRYRDSDEPNRYLYSVFAERRDELAAFLLEHGVDAKIHYPTPLHLQPAAQALGYKRGDFPVAEWCADHTLSLPVHEFIKDWQIQRMAMLVQEFYEPWRSACEGT